MLESTASNLPEQMSRMVDKEVEAVLEESFSRPKQEHPAPLDQRGTANGSRSIKGQQMLLASTGRDHEHVDHAASDNKDQGSEGTLEAFPWQAILH
eukprot:s4167_g9.t1